jgi:putative transposase
MAAGRSIRVLSVVDAYTRECLALEVETSFAGPRVTRVLDALIAGRGRPQAIRCDNGSEFTGQMMDLWAYHSRVKIDFSRPGEPTDNAYVERFNGVPDNLLWGAGRFAPNAWTRIASKAWPTRRRRLRLGGGTTRRVASTGPSKREHLSSSPVVSRLAAIPLHYKSPETNSGSVAEIGDPSLVA